MQSKIGAVLRLHGGAIALRAVMLTVIVAAAITISFRLVKGESMTTEAVDATTESEIETEAEVVVPEGRHAFFTEAYQSYVPFMNRDRLPKEDDEQYVYFKDAPANIGETLRREAARRALEPTTAPTTAAPTTAPATEAPTTAAPTTAAPTTAAPTTAAPTTAAPTTEALPGYSFKELGLTQWSDIEIPDSIRFDANGLPLEYSYSMHGYSTAYCMGTTTATGTSVHPGVVAVNPSVIPYGTAMYIVSDYGDLYGYCRAEDTGGFIYWDDGPDFDLYMWSYDDCIEWGYRGVTAYIF